MGIHFLLCLVSVSGRASPTGEGHWFESNTGHLLLTNEIKTNMDSRYTISILRESIKYTREFTDKIVDTIDQSGDLYKKLMQESDMSIDNCEAAIKALETGVKDPNVNYMIAELMIKTYKDKVRSIVESAKLDERQEALDILKEIEEEINKTTEFLGGTGRVRV